MSKRILVRADDVGYSRGVNYGIADSVWNGIVRSVGVMPNMPETCHGLELLKGSGVCYGQHTNVCLGKPVASPDKIPSLLDEEGNLKSSKVYREAFRKGEEVAVLEEMVLEVEAQYLRYLELVGEKPHYFEGHAVMSKNLFIALGMVAEKYDLPLLGMDFSGNPVKFRNSFLTSSMESMAPDYDPFASLKKAALADYGPDGCAMFISHPGYLDDFLLNTSSLTTPRTKEVAVLTSPLTRRWLEENQIQVVTYDDL